jgi:hypothetical protein
MGPMAALGYTFEQMKIKYHLLKYNFHINKCRTPYF